jgi:prevent-host-death family protein
MEDIQHILPVTKVKRGLLELLKRMEEEQSTIALTRNGEPVGILLTPRRYEALLETIEILSDREIVRALLDSAGDYSAGKVFSHGEVWSE